MTLHMLGRDVFIRHTATNGHSYVQQHRCWDADRFVFAQQAAAAKLNRDAVATDPKALALALADAEQITEDQFHHERKA